MQLQLLHAFIVSLSIGALVGLIRQWADLVGEHEHPSTAGVRTFSLFSVFGFLSAWIHERPIEWFFPAAFLALVFILLADTTAMARRRRKDQVPVAGEMGLTSHVAAILTFLLGALIYWNEFRISIALAASIGLIIATKPLIHGWTRKLNQQDIFSLLQFLAVTGLILPLVPNQGYGPFEAINPYHIWLMVVLISGLGFVGYVAMRWLGAKAGITVTSLFGGLASSTATTLALSKNSQETPELAPSLATGIVLANTIMLARIAAIIFALFPELFFALLPSLLFMALPTTLYLCWRFILQHKRVTSIAIPVIRNPLSLQVAIKFALLYGVIVFLLKAMKDVGGEAGFYPLAFLSGLTEMDAIALSLTQTAKEGEILLAMAARGIVLGAVGNSVFKTALALSIGHKNLSIPILLGMIPMIICGLIALFFV